MVEAIEIRNEKAIAKKSEQMDFSEVANQKW